MACGFATIFSPLTSNLHCSQPYKQVILLMRSILNELLESHYLSRAAAEGWFTEESHNQAMRFGNLPEWAVELSNSIRQAILFCGGSDSCVPDVPLTTNSGNDKELISLFPPDLLWREPLFDQLIANVYQPGEVRLALQTCLCFLAYVQSCK
ncbi:unnamed protein product [Cuscuta epithymum]|uniref:Uncharacterized protein n=1 Tax=Cuscuta epithymum TaxID=186058 RepID=A0AAV0ENH3_9ASTE|nr:unnamed protein product [Cuscuta epithymum]